MDDPVKRSYCLTAADVAQLVHAQGTALKSELARQTEGSSGASVSPLNREDVQTLLAMTDRLLKLGKEIQRCGVQPNWMPSK
jgi:malonyl CoA-acyl carrier protein transacylase